MMTSDQTLRIGLDFTTLDHLTLNNGQYRYVVDLIRGLSEVSPDWVQLIVFGSKPQPVAEIADIFQNDHHRWRYQQIQTWKFKGSDYLNQLRYVAILAANRINVFHILHSFIPIFALCKFVYTQHDLMEEIFKEYSGVISSRPYQIRKWSVKHRVSRIIAISQCTANDTVRLWQVPSERISVVYHGAQFDKINHANSEIVKLIQSHSGQALLSVFNLEPRKNLNELLAAMPILLAQYPNLRLFLFGKAAWTPERQQTFTALIQELGIEDRVICTGFVQDDELALLYRYATIFIFPSLYEGFGLPILEAMAQGACVIARDASSMAEIVGEAGVLIEPCDRYNLATAIANLLENEELRANLSQAAQDRANEFTITKMAANTLKVYTDLSRS